MLELNQVIPPSVLEKYNVLPEDVVGIPSTLKEKTINLNDKEGNFNSIESIKSFRQNSLYAIMKKLFITDEAFLNSILSYSVYSKNSWMMDSMGKSFMDMADKFKESIKTKEGLYDLKVWHFLSNTFEKIPDEDLMIPKESINLNGYQYVTHYTYKDGQYSANNGLAHASILKSKNLNGEGNILHLTFRGTEFSRLFEYMKGPYLDMSAYYEQFRPLEKYLKAYVSDPKNNISEIHVNGHSLGGAMVQQFLKNNPKDSFPVPIKGFTFGSPGAEKKWYHKFFTLAYHTLGRGIPIDSSDNIKAKHDQRLHEFYHSNDPVPRIGLLGYSKIGVTMNLLDNAYKEDQQAKIEKKSFLESIPAFGGIISYFKENVLNKFNTKFHDSSRYIVNLRDFIEDHYQKHPEIGNTLQSKSKNWSNWVCLEKNFGALSIRYKRAFEKIIKEEHPDWTKEEVNSRVLEIREKMKYDTQAQIVLSKTRQTGESYDQFLTKTTIASASDIKEHSEKIKVLNKNRLEELRKTYDIILEQRSDSFLKQKHN